MEIVIITAIVAAIAVLVYILLYRNRERGRLKQRAFLNRVSHFASRHNLRFSSQEQLSANAVLGIDGVYSKVLYMYNTGKPMQESAFILVDLLQVKQCVVKKVHRAIYTAGKRYSPYCYIDKILLRFEFTNDRSPAEIPFYNSAGSNRAAVTTMYRKALQWQQMINKMTARRA